MARWNASSAAEDAGLLVEASRLIAQPMGTAADLDALIERIGDARFVLLGEASHGTSEFYKWRGLISQRLIREKGFNFIAVEGDWPDCYRLNRYVKGYSSEDESAFQVLHQFNRWPTWMWANWEIAALGEWLRSFNAKSGRRVGFYGLDVYSLFESMHAIVGYLEKKDPEMARLARQAYACFEPYAEDVQAYAWSTRMVPESCENEVIDLLKGLRGRVTTYDGDPEAAFSTEQNALVMVDAERYYRAMVRSDQNSWNVRDIHMADTLDRLLELHGDGSKAIIWAHNTHVGDARYTDMAADGMVNIGQIVRERKGEENTFLVGFGTHHGTVIAANAWDDPMRVMGVPDAVENSWEDILYRTGLAAFYMLLQEKRSENLFTTERGNRAIGVVYQPGFERFGNYVPTRLSQRYDAFSFIAETQALHPLHLQEEKEPEVPETYPWGL